MGDVLSFKVNIDHKLGLILSWAKWGQAELSWDKLSWAEMSCVKLSWAEFC